MTGSVATSPRRAVTLVVAAVVGAVLALGVGIATGGDGPDGAEDASGRFRDQPSESTTQSASAPPVTEQQVADEPLRRFAAEAVAAVVRRDHSTYDDDVAAAVPLLTEELAAEFSRTAAAVRDGFVEAGTVVTVAVRGTGVVQSTADGGQVLVLLDEISRTRGGAPRTTPQAVLASLTGPPDALRLAALSGDLATSAAPTDPDRAALVRSARDLVTPLVNTTAAHYDRDVARARAFTADPLTRSLPRAAQPLRALTRRTGALRGVSGAVGVESLTATEASVLVAATVEVEGAGRARTHTVRMRLGLTQVGGAWRTHTLRLLQ